MRYSVSLLAAGLLMGALVAPASADPFSDVPTDHWAYEAIEQLQAEGIVEGYPDGTFKGNRAFTRYEMAMVVARLYTKLSQMPVGEAGLTQEDLDEYKAMIDSLMNEFRDELADLADRMDALEGRVDDLEDRVGALERIRQAVQWSGMLRMRAEDIITGDDGAFNTEPGDPSTIPFQPGQFPDAGPEFEEKIMIALEAQPSDFIDVYVDMWQI
ncbi:MAG TPA: S-layer homology domain-containing protein, partial [bacterium]|nr:S-layer homology domain-containing protein [bacterium]